jgi:hypothetical protein
MAANPLTLDLAPILEPMVRAIVAEAVAENQ